MAFPRPQSDDGFWGWIATVDHKKIGIMYFVASFINLLIGGLEAMLLRLQIAQPRLSIIHPDLYNELFTMHGTTMIFLALMPMSAAFFNYLVPLMIGARDVAFPRLNSFGLWTFVLGSVFLNTSWFVGAAPNAGWFAYAPLTELQFNNGPNVDFYVFGLQMVGISSVMTGLNFLVTILNMRAPGMSMMQMPVFVWTTLITAFLLIFALPSITVAAFMLMFDRLFATNFFVAQAGADVHLWQHLFWIFGHPEVYILILPAMGVISEVLPVFSRKPLYGYTAIVLSTALIGFVGFGTWAHHMYASGLGPTVTSVFTVTTMLVAVPTGVKILNWIATLWGGTIRYTTAALFAISFLFLFTIGGLSGVMHAAAPSDTQQHDTYFIVAHLHYVLIGGTLVGFLSAIYYWFPKVTGRKMSERLGKLHFWLFFIAFNVTFFPQHFLGIAGMPRRIYTYEQGLGFGSWNLVSTIGAWGLGFTFLLLVYNMFQGVRNGERVENDPWDGRTLEWSISSPPPHYNFASLPQVTVRDAWWAEKHPELGHPDGPKTTVDRDVDGPKEDLIHLPGPSYYPALASLGLMITSFGGTFRVGIVAAIGLIITLFSIFAWAFEGVGGTHVDPKSGKEVGHS